MNLNQDFGVRPGKVAELRKRIAQLKIDARKIGEKFVRGGGPGGQKINKTSSAVVLTYAPLDLMVRCQRERKQSANRFIALRELVDQIEMKISPRSSKKLKEIEHKQAAKARSGRRARAHAREGEEE